MRYVLFIPKSAITSTHLKIFAFLSQFFLLLLFFFVIHITRYTGQRFSKLIANIPSFSTVGQTGRFNLKKVDLEKYANNFLIIKSH